LSSPTKAVSKVLGLSEFFKKSLLNIRIYFNTHPLLSLWEVTFFTNSLAGNLFSTLFRDDLPQENRSEILNTRKRKNFYLRWQEWQSDKKFLTRAPRELLLMGSLRELRQHFYREHAQQR